MERIGRVKVWSVVVVVDVMVLVRRRVVHEVHEVHEVEVGRCVDLWR